MKLSWDIGVSSMAKMNEELCGDVVEIKKGVDSTVVVLSDGLGSGVKANILANLTAKIVASLLTRGVELPEVVETVAETLPVCKTRQIAYSTFTILQLFEEGVTYITQYDNPSVLYIHCGSPTPVITPVSGKKLHVAGKNVTESKKEMTEGDILIMVSDGVTHAGIGALLPLGLGEDGLVRLIKNEINLNLDSHDIADQIIQYCEAYSASEAGDDITVVVLKLRRPVKGVVLSGPPLIKENDSKIVEEFFAGNRHRVICGGTTANIVAREKNLNLKVKIDYQDLSLPPVASLSGVDLVTEGILTLTRVTELLEEGNFQNTGKKDGAHQLLCWFMGCDEIELMVGLRVNPAHLSPELPFHLGLRSSLLQRLRDLLVGRGKKVTIKWF